MIFVTPDVYLLDSVQSEDAVLNKVASLVQLQLELSRNAVDTTQAM